MSSNTMLTALTSRRVPLILVVLASLGALILAAERAQSSSLPAPTNLSGEAVTTGLKISWDAPDSH